MQWRQREIALGDMGDFKPALIFSSATLVEYEGFKEDADFKRDFDPVGSAKTELQPQVSAETEGEITYLDIRHGSADFVRLAIGSMGQPMAAMRKCTDELLTHWGIDVEAHRGLTRPVVPASNPGYWLKSNDYPSGLLQKGAQGIIKFRLSVDMEGKPTGCHIQQSTRPAGFDQAVCDGLMRRAKFEPALGADGRPIASYWNSTARFKL